MNKVNRIQQLWQSKWEQRGKFSTWKVTRVIKVYANANATFPTSIKFCVNYMFLQSMFMQFYHYFVPYKTTIQCTTLFLLFIKGLFPDFSIMF